MRADLRAIPLAQRTFLAGWTLLCIGLFYSPFLASAGTALFLLALFLDRHQGEKIPTMVYLLYGAPLMLLLTDLLRGTSALELLDKALLAAGFLLIGLAVYRLGFSLLRYWKYAFAVLLGLILFTDMATVAHYLVNKTELDLLLLQSKSIPVFGGMHHIHFGILNALGIMGLLYAVLFHRPAHRTAMLVLAGLFLISFHILSSRTGLLSFYVALLCVVLVYAIKQKAYLTGFIALASLVAVNAVALSLSSSFKNKVQNSMEDIQSWEGQPEDINFKSMAMRLEAYKACWAIIRQHPFSGVGDQAMNKEIQQMYTQMDTALFQENRVGPHNQLLEYGVKYGIWGVAYVLFFFLYWLRKAMNPLDYGALSLVLIIGAAVQFESLFERQVGIFIVAGLLSLIHSWRSWNIRTA